MLHIVIIFACLLASTAIGSTTPERTTLDILISVYGPLEPWDAIRATDVDPHGIFDGNPANDSIIIAYEPPKSAGPEKRALAASLFAQRDLRRASCNLCCYDSGNWVDQNQLYSAKDTYCADAAATILNTGEHQQYKNWWQDSDGTWKQFTNQDNKFISVWFHMKVGAYSIAQCRSFYEGIITRCRGKKPDSAGGMWYTETGAYGLDPVE